MGHTNDLCTPDGKVGVCHTLEVERPGAVSGLLAARCPFPSSSSMLALRSSSTLFQTCPHHLLANKASRALSFPWHCPMTLCLVSACCFSVGSCPGTGQLPATQSRIFFFVASSSPSSAPTKLNFFLGTLRVPPTPSSNNLLYIFRSLPLGKLVVWLGPHMLPHPVSFTSGSTS